jgi:hypothetical protein
VQAPTDRIGGMDLMCSSEIRWRRGWDLNPRYPLRYVRFRGGSFQPLTHLSGKQLSAISRKPQQIPRCARNDSA